MIPEEQWNQMSSAQQTQACLTELNQMIWEAVREIQWLPLNDGTLVVQGFNTLVGRKEGDFPDEV